MDKATCPQWLAAEDTYSTDWWPSPGEPFPARQHDLLKNPFSLTSDVFISSISAKVGALSRTRGLGRWLPLPASVTDRLMQEVDLTSPEQALRMQGREPNPEGRKKTKHGGR